MARWYMVLYKLQVNPNLLGYGRFPVLSASAKDAITTAQVALPGIKSISVRGIANQNIKLIHLNKQ